MRAGGGPAGGRTPGVSEGRWAVLRRDIPGPTRERRGEAGDDERSEAGVPEPFKVNEEW